MPGGWVMPCFEPVLTIIAGMSDAIIAGAKAATPWSTPIRLTSISRRHTGEHVAARADCGVVHEEGRGPAQFLGQRDERIGIGDVERVHARAFDRARGCVERLTRAVDQRDAHATFGERARRGEPNPARGTRHHREPSGRDRGEGGGAHRSIVAIEG